MAKLRNVFLQVFAASCLLVTVSSYNYQRVGRHDDGSYQRNQWLEEIVRNLTRYPVIPPDGGQQSAIPSSFTSEQLDYYKRLYDKIRPTTPDDERTTATYRKGTDDYEQQQQQIPYVNDDFSEDEQVEFTTTTTTSTATMRSTTTPDATTTDINNSDEEEQAQQQPEDDESDEVVDTTTSSTSVTTTTSTTEATTTEGKDSDEEEQTQQKPEDDDSDEESTTTSIGISTSTTTTTETTTTERNDSDEEEQAQQKPEDDDSDEESTTTTTTMESTTSTSTVSPSTTTSEATTTDGNDSDENEQEKSEEDDSDEEPTTTTESTTTSTTTKQTTTTETTTTTTLNPICFGFKPYPDSGFYLQFNGVRWVKMLCPHGFGFDYNACACSMKLETAKPSIPETTTTTQRTTTTKTTLELCDNCVMLHGVGYAPFPGYCESYVQCEFSGSVPTAANIRQCPAGLQWNQNKLACDFEENVKCVSVNNCPNHKAIDGDFGAYLVFDGQNWSRVSCPSGSTYNAITCGCTDKHHDDDDNHGNHDNCWDKKAIIGDKTGFMQLTGNGWMRMPCPVTLGYNENICQCSDRLDNGVSTNQCPDKKPATDDNAAFLQFDGMTWVRMPCHKPLVYNSEKCICVRNQTDDDDDSEEDDSKDDDVCKSTLTLTFNENDAKDSSKNRFWVNNTGVTFNEGKAFFNGKSRLTVPGLSNMELGNTVYILIKYKHSSASSQQTLVANGDCQVRQSMAICSGKDSVDFYAETTGQLAPAKVKVPTDIGQWQYAIYALDKDTLQGNVGANQASQPIKGALDRRQRGLVIGGGGDCDNFHGVIDDIQVYLCKPQV